MSYTFSKCCNEYFPYIGGSGGFTFYNDYIGRAQISYPTLEDWESIRESSELRLYGAWNDRIEHAAGLIEPEQIPSLLAMSSFYQYVYTTPPSYTLSFIEALMAGTPVIAPSERYIRSKIETENNGWWPDRYEVPSLLANGAGIVFDDVRQAARAAKALSPLRDLRMHVSECARAASEKFDAKNIAPQWQELVA